MGQSFVVEIPFQAWPKADVTWKYKNGKLPDQRRFKIDTIHGMTSLNLSKAKKSDSGLYSITIVNLLGRDTLKIEIVVLGKLLF